MTVKVNGVRDRGSGGELLDEVIIPTTGGEEREDVHFADVVGITVLDVGEGGTAPVDVDVGVVDGPYHDRVLIGEEDSRRDVDVEAFRRLVEGPAGDVLDPVRGHVGGFSTAVGGQGPCGGVGIRCGDGIIRPHGATDEIIRGETVRRGLRTEPVVARGLIGGDDHIVSLTDVDEEPLCGKGLDGDKVGGHDVHGVTIEGDVHGLIDRHVDQSQSVLFPLCHLDVVVGSTAGGVFVGAIDQDVVGGGGSPSRLQTDE